MEGMSVDVDREKVIRGLEACSLGPVCGDNCPYEEVQPENCIAAMARDVLKLLEEKKARLMPLEEIKEGNWDYVYLEQEIIPASKEITAFTGFRHRVSCVTWPSITAMKISPGEKEYGRKWRCWTERPTDEQRKETPWAE